MADTSRSWRVAPFAVGRRYRVRRNYKAFRDSFVEGEIVTYENDSYSAYHGYTGYIFGQVGTHQKRVWDIHDDDDLGIWRELFEEMG